MKENGKIVVGDVWGWVVLAVITTVGLVRMIEVFVVG